MVHAEHVLPPPDTARRLSGTVPGLSPLVAEQGEMVELDDREDLELWDGGAGCKKKSKSKKRKRSSAKSLNKKTKMKKRKTKMKKRKTKMEKRKTKLKKR